ncbi:hypothetical protein GGS21DRAFT_530769 [Xylaria nigripes]|nr:hypothetical protein GGS21DRAFT_530769 [Xylaria nigripes]
MVVRTPTLGSLRKGFLSQIHRPLPLNQRDLQQLQDLITTSFRKNLDREHPWETDGTSTDTSVNPSTSALAENHRPTDRHLSTILSNPLFAHSRNAKNPTVSAPTSHKNPFDVFDSAVSKGLMTPRRAAGFLATIRSQQSAQSSDGIHQPIGTSGPGLRVLQWLRASGHENSLDFLSDAALVKLLIPVLYAEGLQQIAWNWLSLLASRVPFLEFEKITGEPVVQTLSRLMTAIIRSSQPISQHPVSLDESFAALAKVNDMLPRESSIATAAVKDVWAKLSWASTVNASQRPKPSAKLFEEFVEIGRPLNLPLDLAHLDLHHPTVPTHSAAIEYLRPRQKIIENVTNMKPKAQQRVLCLVWDAAERLEQTGQFSEAPWIERLKVTIHEKLGLGALNISAFNSKWALNERIKMAI